MVATRLVHRMRVRAEEALTGREIEVLELVARGSSNADVAARLFISEATVKTHLLHIFGKLGVDDHTAAVVSAMERGIIALPPPESLIRKFSSSVSSAGPEFDRHAAFPRRSVGHAATAARRDGKDPA